MPVALITGTSTGIGRETALHFARQGYRVFAGVRSPAAVEEHPNIIAVKLDVDQDESVREAVDRVWREAGVIDGRASLWARDGSLMAFVRGPTCGRDDARCGTRAIYGAVHTDEPKLRYSVGADAEVMAPARDRLSAAEWEDLQSEPDEETFLARAKEVFGVDLYNAPSLNARRRARQVVTAPGYGICAG